MLYELLITPFELRFMQRALLSCLFLAASAGPIGVFLVLRRMSLSGDALAHGVLPGATAGYLIAGFSLPAMSLGGFISGMLMVWLSGLVSRHTKQREDASMAAFYLIALALGVTLISWKGSLLDVNHLLFGAVLAVDQTSLYLIATVSSLSLILFIWHYRSLVLAVFDPEFFRTQGGNDQFYIVLLQILMVANLVVSFQAIGTLMGVGLMMLPAASARFWQRRLLGLCGVAIFIALLSAVIGLLLSYHTDLPSGPAIILTCGFFYLCSLFFGLQEGLAWRFSKSHFSQ